MFQKNEQPEREAATHSEEGGRGRRGKGEAQLRYRLPKAVILIVVLYAMVRMWHWKIGFTFFTQLSNLYLAAAVLLQLIAGKGRLRALKYSAVVSITVTFLVYLCVLGPMTPGGLIAAYRQDHCASLCMHALAPLTALTDYLLNDRESARLKNWCFYALLPPVIWFGFILILGAAGFRWGPGMTAPYPFLNYAAPAGWFGFQPGTMSFTTLGIGVFYALVLMLALFRLTGWAVLRIGTEGGARRRSPKED